MRCVMGVSVSIDCRLLLLVLLLCAAAVYAQLSDFVTEQSMHNTYDGIQKIPVN